MFAKILYFMPELYRQGKKEVPTYTKTACTHYFVSWCNADLIALFNSDSRKCWQHQEFGLDILCLLLKLKNTSILEFTQNSPKATDYL